MFVNALLVSLLLALSANAAVIALDESKDASIGDLDSNAKRFQHGLTPLPPRAILRVARDNAMKRADEVLTGCSGTIQVSKADDSTIIGYISQDLNYGAYTLGNIYNAVETEFPCSHTESTTVIALKDVTNDRVYTPYIGGVSLVEDSSTAPLLAMLVGVEDTIPLGPPQSSLFKTVDNGQIEASIWTYNPLNGQFSAQWVNSDSSLPPTYLFYNSAANGTILLVSDMDAYSAYNPLSYPIILTLLSNE